jgi:hypothetical protein
MSAPQPEPSEPEQFTEEEMRLAGIYCRALTGGPTDFDREVQEHLDRLEKKRSRRKVTPP